MRTALVRVYRPTKSWTVPLPERPFLVGSGDDCDLCIREGGLADAALQIVGKTAEEQGRLEAMRQGRVLLNGRKVKTASLRPGDRIEVADTVLVFDVETGGEMLSEAPAAGLLSEMATFAERVGNERDLRELLKAILDLLLKSLDATDGFVFTTAEDGNLDVFVSTHGDDPQNRFSDTIVQEVLHTGQGVFVPNALSDPKFSQARSVVDLSLSTALCVPMLVAGRFVGVLYVGSHRPGTSYSEYHLSLLTTFSAIAGMLIRQVEFLDQQRTTISRLTESGEYEGIVARSKAMTDALQRAESAAGSSIAVMLEGETGTGKDLVAGLIHRLGGRASQPFVVVNCGSLRKELVQSELFGHRKGSFTGAVDNKRGLFSLANGGTLFLDEIGELDLAVQAELLRALETGRIRAVGAEREESVDVRIVCATNRNLDSLVESRSFRSDLYYRLNQFTIRIPPLRERGNDVVLLAYHFLEMYRHQYPDREIMDFDADSLAFLSSHHWPGNVRELASRVHQAVVACRGSLAHLERPEAVAETMDLETATRTYQRQLIRKALAAAGDNKERAAHLLGIHRSTLFRYLSPER